MHTIRYQFNYTSPGVETDICAIYVPYISNEFSDFGDHSHAFEQTERTTKKSSRKLKSEPEHRHRHATDDLIWEHFFFAIVNLAYQCQISDTIFSPLKKRKTRKNVMEKKWLNSTLQWVSVGRPSCAALASLLINFNRRNNDSRRLDHFYRLHASVRCHAGNYRNSLRQTLFECASASVGDACTHLTFSFFFRRHCSPRSLDGPKRKKSNFF